MGKATAAPPSLVSLERALRTILAPHEGLAVVERSKNVFSSTFPSEVITCRTTSGETWKLFCKYVTRAVSPLDERSVEPLYEIDTYRHLLELAPLTTAKFHGFWRPDAGAAWLVLEFLEGGLRLIHTYDQTVAMQDAAGWIGGFHAYAEARLAHDEVRFLRRFDEAYFFEQRDRMREACRQAKGTPSWLERLLERFARVAEILLEAPQTVIHGEYYPRNILYRDASIFPVDWETAAVSAGEIDLATLTERWPTEMVEGCNRRYAEARGVEVGSEAFARRLAAARMYLNVHWLGSPSHPSRTKWSERTHGTWRLEHLKQDAEALGLV